MNSGGHSIEAGRHRGDVDRVEVIARPLDLICQSEALEPTDVGVVWIDVEGHELAVLEGMKDLSAAGAPIILEFDGGAHGEAGVQALKDLLVPHYSYVVDLRSVVRGETGDGKCALAEFSPQPGARDLLIY